MWSCGTHNFKALRNNIHRAQLTKSKSFLNCGVPFSWNEIESTFEREISRLTKNMPQRTDLNKNSVYLDNFTVMNASYAKKCFSEKTISKMLLYVSAHMNVRLDIGLKFQSLWHQFMFTCNSLKQKVTVDTPLEVKSYISILQYQIAVHGIYIERFINKKWRIDRGNILSEKEIVKCALRYFTGWKFQRVNVTTQIKMTRRDADTFFIADQTFHKLLQCVGGFFEYSKAVLGLKDVDNIEFIPVLRSNQSSLENFFQE